MVQPEQEIEVPLVGGNTTHGVVRVGDTVRRPATSASVSVDAFLRHLNEVGCTGAPRTLGFDERGRHVVEHVEGQILMPFVPVDPPSALRRVGRLLRELHDAAESFTPADDAVWNVVIPPDKGDLIVHHDAAPWNLVLGNGRWVLIDWDNAGPGSRLWDLAYAAHAFVPLAPQTPVEDAARLLVALVDGYGLDEGGRAGLTDLLVPRTLGMYELLERGSEQRRQPWAQLWDEGHGEVWRGDADYIDRHLTGFRNALLDLGQAKPSRPGGADSQRLPLDTAARLSAMDLDPSVTRKVNGVTDPAAQADERQTLLAFLQRQRDLVAWKVAGVDDALLREQRTPTGLTAPGLVRHLENVERSWLRDVFAGQEGLRFDWSAEAPDGEWEVPDDVPIARLLEAYQEECRRCDEVVATADLDQVSATRGASLRWVLLHLVEETARHVGHLDLLRERADGATGEDPF